MSRFLLGRALQAAAVLLVVTLVVFGLLHALPGTPARAILGPRADPSAIAAFNRTNGFDLSLPSQYLRYVTRLLHGDLGFSYRRNEPVTRLLAASVPRTMLLVGLSTALAAALAVPVGMAQAVRRDRASDRVLTGVTLTMYSMPVFWLALLLVDVFAVRLGWLPPEASPGGAAQMLTHPAGLVLPVASLSLVTLASFSRYVRASTVEQLDQDYVRTARAKGLRGGRLVRRHVLRNALSPVVSLLGLSLPWVLSGSLVVEAVFNVPGTGFLFWNAAQGQDYPVMLGIVLVAAAGTVVGSLLADLAYAALDPRLRGQAGTR